MGMIADTIKKCALQKFDALQKKGDSNEVDINEFTSSLQARIIVSSLVGEKYADTEIPYIDMKTGQTSKKTITNVLHNFVGDLFERITRNPFLSFGYFDTFAEKEVFTADKHYLENCRQTRAYLAKIIDDKKAAKDPEAKDIVSLLLEDPNYQDTQEIVDDVLVMFLAGSQTV